MLFASIIPIFALFCKKDSMECMGTLLRVCTEEGYWSEMHCPENTKCLQTNNSVSCKRIKSNNVDKFIDRSLSDQIERPNDEIDNEKDDSVDSVDCSKTKTKTITLKRSDYLNTKTSENINECNTKTIGFEVSDKNECSKDVNANECKKDICEKGSKECSDGMANDKKMVPKEMILKVENSNFPGNEIKVVLSDTNKNFKDNNNVLEYKVESLNSGNSSISQQTNQIESKSIQNSEVSAKSSQSGGNNNPMENSVLSSGKKKYNYKRK